MSFSSAGYLLWLPVYEAVLGASLDAMSVITFFGRLDHQLRPSKAQASEGNCLMMFHVHKQLKLQGHQKFKISYILVGLLQLPTHSLLAWITLQTSRIF